jgi:hypothetical protein
MLIDSCTVVVELPAYLPNDAPFLDWKSWHSELCKLAAERLTERSCICFRLTHVSWKNPHHRVTVSASMGYTILLRWHYYLHHHNGLKTGMLLAMLEFITNLDGSTAWSIPNKTQRLRLKGKARGVSELWDFWDGVLRPEIGELVVNCMLP